VRKKIISNISFLVDDDSTPGENAWKLFWFVCLSIFLFIFCFVYYYYYYILVLIAYSCTGNIAAIKRLSPLPVYGSHLLRHRPSVLKLISKRPVILTSSEGEIPIYFNGRLDVVGTSGARTDDLSIIRQGLYHWTHVKGAISVITMSHFWFENVGLV
jgi:hypothetical protein